MKNQVLSIEQMQELKELGIDISNSVIGWFKWNKEDTWYLLNETIAQRREKIETMIENNCFHEDDYESYKYTFIPTFTLQDILERLPDIGKEYINHPHVFKASDGIHWYCSYGTMTCEIKGKTPLEAAFNMLKWVKQNNYLNG